MLRCPASSSVEKPRLYVPTFAPTRVRARRVRHTDQTCSIRLPFRLRKQPQKASVQPPQAILEKQQVAPDTETEPAEAGTKRKLASSLRDIITHRASQLSSNVVPVLAIRDRISSLGQHHTKHRQPDQTKQQLQATSSTGLAEPDTAAQDAEPLAQPPQTDAGPATEVDNGQQSEDEAEQTKQGVPILLRLTGKGKQEPVVEDLPPLKCGHPVLQLLRERRISGSSPGGRSDPFKLGLVVEGGGMRGAVSGGGLLELGNMGFRECFDACYGSSAGAINLTYFLSGQREGVRVYTDDIANKRFCDLGRLQLWRKDADAGPVLDLAFLLDHVLEYVKPLDWQAVLDAPIPLKVVASSLDSLGPVLLDNFQDKQDLVTCLKASANVPAIAGDPIVHRGQRLVDAAVFEAVPFRAAIADGCTHILTLCTRPISRAGRMRKVMSGLFEGTIKRAVMSPDYMKPAWQAEVDMVKADGLSDDEMLSMALDDGAEQKPFFAGTHVYPVFPGAGAKYAPVCIDPPTLHQGIDEGRLAVRRILEPYTLHAKNSFEPVVIPELTAIQQQHLQEQLANMQVGEIQAAVKEYQQLGDGMAVPPQQVAK